MWSWIKQSLWRNALPSWLNWLLTSICIGTGMVVAEVGFRVPFNGWPGAAISFFGALAAALLLYPIANALWRKRSPD